MKRLLALLALFSALSFAGVTLAQDKPASGPAEAVSAQAASAPAAAPSQAAPSPPVPNKGDTVWLMVSTILVILMTIPGLALFYGGLVRAKNTLSVLMQVFVIFCMVALLWAIYGYSIAFTEGNAFFGSLDKAFLAGITADSNAGTFSKGVVVPEYVYVAFQLTFAAITAALIVGGFAERMKFSAVLLFTALWFTFAYAPIAHMVWYWAGPDAYTDAAAAEAAGATAGFIFQKGALDFAGGTVVHINAGITGLIGAYLVGKRIGYGREAMSPHSLTLTMVGASLLWVGWFGFNVGSNLEANNAAGLVFINTLLATAAATLAWTALEWTLKGKPSMLGGASGAISGLVAITPACGWVGPMGAIVLGAIAGALCLWGVNGLKRVLGADDALDVFGVHCVGGITGAIGVAIFASPALGGTGVLDYVTEKVAEYDMLAQLGSQIWGVATTLVWSGVVAYLAYKLVDMTIGLRVTEEEEREGLDINSHGESAYHL